MAQWAHNKTRKQPRHGTQCVLQYPTNRNPAQSLEDNAITVFGPRLYNSLPKYLRDIESVKTEKIKFELDIFSTPFLISQKCPTMSPHQETKASSASSLIWGLKEFTTMVESPTRPWSSLICFEATPSKYSVVITILTYVTEAGELKQVTSEPV